MSLHVRRSTGGRLSFYKASIRYFAKPLTLLAFLRRFVPGAGPAPHHLLHDELADALVVPRR
ncbi:hypothetical protein [Pontibacter liquoris]|uniref:hypothetical protein n=1 Tax=Pontibacter liquoris TaxID=2905677 RepID=UPI003462DC49